MAKTDLTISAGSTGVTSIWRFGESNL
jgi:hypothetical protein